MKLRFKANSMMQWIEYNRNKTFINLPSLPWKSEISAAIHLAQPGVTAGRQIKSRGILKFLKFTVQRNLQLFALFNQGTASLEQLVLMYSRWFFQVKLITRPF